MKTEEEYKKEFGKQISRYLSKSGLDIKDFAKQIKSNIDNVNSIIAGEVGLTIGKMIMIANLFGVPYYDFANPNYPIPSKSELIKNLKNVINKRKIIGNKPIDKERLLSKDLDRLISEGHINTPTTSKILHKKMASELQIRNTSEITTLLGNSPRNDFIIELNHKYNKQNIYIHKDYIHKFNSFTAEELAQIIIKKEKELELAKKNNNRSGKI